MLNVVLYQPEIPPNTGNIGRLCHATESRLHLIEPLGFSLDEKSLKRAGLDYWQELDVTVWASLEECLSTASSPEAKIWYLTTKSENCYWDASFSDGDFLVFGPETRGLPETIIFKKPEQSLTIPQRAGRSINLATSVGIVLYEALRQIDR